MDQDYLFKSVPRDKFEILSKEEMVKYLELQQDLIDQIVKDNQRLRSLNNELKQKSLYIDEQLITIKNKLFGKSSEKEPSKEDRKKAKGKSKKKVLLPSLRYPNAPLIERRIDFEKAPDCKCCSGQMKDSGMTENSEFLTVIPAQHLVIRQMRCIYRCDKCHGSLVTAPSPPRINPGSSYSDEMAIDVALSKYCDLIPVERYCAIAGRNGLEDLPPQSLIDQTHVVADFVEGASNKVKDEILDSVVILADETPHKMLEGSEISNWYLWGFSNPTACYFEIRDTRSGDVASELLTKSKCEFLMSDVFSGYAKAVRETNEARKKLNIPPLISIHCNSHARRNFKGAQENFPEESQYFIDIYKKIYRLEKIAKARPPDRVLRARRYMASLFEKMRKRAIENIAGYSSKSSIYKAMSYFLKNYEAFTKFITNKYLPIDNNRQEALLRNPVVGRKTWYGTHSIRGAKTAAIMYTLVESCKLNEINPRKYFQKLIQNIHEGKNCFTPREFKYLTQ
jgi:transposase